MKDIADVTTYLKKHGPALAGRIAERFKPLVTAPQLDVRRELKKLKRAPFPAQAGVIEGLVALFGSGRRHGFIVAEFLLEKTPAQLRILTKNAEVREDFDVMERYPGRVIVGLSAGIPPGREDMARAVEPNASSVADRLAALREAHERGLRTFGMPCPILPSVAESVDALQCMFEESRDCGVEDIWTESVNSRGRGLIHTAEALRQAGLDADAVDAVRSSAAWSASARKLIENAEAAAKAAGVSDRIKILLYPSKLTPNDRQAIRETSRSVSWLK